MVTYSVSAAHGGPKKREFTSLAKAKEYAVSLAKKMAWKSGFNVSWLHVGIYYIPVPGYGIQMYSVPYPVRGTGSKAEKILAAMRKHGSPAFKIIKNPNFKRAVVRFRMGTGNFDAKYGSPDAHGHMDMAGEPGKFERAFKGKRVRL